ncbi:sensor histidine kinase [Massilia yuzhufengensis]|uniref:histidine kinase n=1 Tax=Massilia yuzhufengensis TaxID=1164594 RepID=A0A1I1KTR5_9BURK|nr:ATP-binding protein [Massilia yuzhufengensis]SFC62108.1 Signal transduction histidine kinase involved in nitrogen fixation and metabolism regulation [Massilia yuzhufengensis]
MRGKSVNQALRYALVVGGAIVSILLFLLASASDNSGFFDKYYTWLLGVNAGMAVLLLILVIVALARLYSRYKAGKFGSRLVARLVLLFAGIGILPGLVIFMVSVNFVSHSIDSWFDVKIEAAIESGLNLGRAALDEAVAELGASGQTAAATLAGQDAVMVQGVLSSLVNDISGLQSAILLSPDGTVLASSAQDRNLNLDMDRPTPDMLKSAALPGGYARPEGTSDVAGNGPSALDAATGLRLRVVLAVPESHGIEPRYLQLLQSVPVNLASNAVVLRSASEEYRSRSQERSGLRKMYIETLTLTLLLAIFGAIGSAFLIADNLAQPLLVLAEGTQAVAEGDLSPRPTVETNDELGTLTRSFNAMTGQLFEARSAVERNRTALQNAKAHLESVLANMSAGVIVLDAEGRVVNSNDAAYRILQVEPGALAGPLASIAGLDTFYNCITRAISAQSAQSAAGSAGVERRRRAHWQQQIEIARRGSGDEQDHDITLLARGSRLPVGTGSGFIVVFDDISDVISVQRSVAWGEVARRLAHEIKNPLTPIQLSAERLQMKLEGSLPPLEAELLKKSTTTIVNQVDAMKRMVDDFRDYARTPPAVLEPLDLNALIDEILQLYLSEDGTDVIHANLAANLPRVMGDPTQLRQVIHNLVQNAQDALADRDSGEPARVDVVTEAIHYEGADGAAGTAVRLAITDNGPGFSPRILARAFEPYVTSKARGTGLGLPMVKKIIDEHGGRIDIGNQANGCGASVFILLLKLAPEANLAE